MQKTPIHYSQCWEDAELLLKALDVGHSDRILSITSGGCNTLALASARPAGIDAVDVNRAQFYLLEVKMRMLEFLDLGQVLEFMGVFSSDNRIDLYRTIRSHLSEDCRTFWDENQEVLKSGLAHSGKFEKYLRYFSFYLLPVAHGKNHIHDLLVPKSGEEQQHFYEQTWDNVRWRLLFRLFFSAAVMKKAGRSKEMFRHANIPDVSDHYLKKARNALASPVAFNNSYTEYVLKGNYEDECPFILQPHNFLLIRENLRCIRNNNADLLTFLKQQKANFYTKMNLSDVFEPMTVEKSNLIFEEIARVCKHGARIIFWNNLVPRTIPDYLSGNFYKESELERHLKEKEKVFFYETLNIYTIRK